MSNEWACVAKTHASWSATTSTSARSTYHRPTGFRSRAHPGLWLVVCWHATGAYRSSRHAGEAVEDVSTEVKVPEAVVAGAAVVETTEAEVTESAIKQRKRTDERKPHGLALWLQVTVGRAWAVFHALCGLRYKRMQQERTQRHGRPFGGLTPELTTQMSTGRRHCNGSLAWQRRKLFICPCQRTDVLKEYWVSFSSVSFTHHRGHWQTERHLISTRPPSTSTGLRRTVPRHKRVRRPSFSTLAFLSRGVDCRFIGSVS